LLTLFGQANKVRRAAGRNPPFLIFFIFMSCSSIQKHKTKTGSLRTAGRHTFVRQQKYAKMPSLSRGLWTFAKGLWLSGAAEETIRPFTGGLTVLLS